MMRQYSRLVSARLVAWIDAGVTAEVDISSSQLLVEDLLGMLLRLI